MVYVFKCKCCTANLNVEEGMHIVECDYCGTKQTVPSSRDENIQNLFNRATTLRLKAEFDKAEQVYERIIQADEEQAEAYWGLILCKYGVEYVDDPKTLKKIPTCHRTSYESIIADPNYELTLKYAYGQQKVLYELDAKAIDKVQKNILAAAQNEEPFDVFICYKETDSNGKRTQDSVVANDIYHQLTQEGFKVFYAAITLEGKLGSAYEPIIFSALNSAKVMLAIGTKPEYFNAVWVKNEWSRFIKINKDDRSKLLIPCYKDMDAYDLPDEFAHLQAQDMSKIGFINDIVRGIKKLVEKKQEIATTVVVRETNTQLDNLLKRAQLSLENGEFDKAKGFAEQALNIDVENGQAYIIELLCDTKSKGLQQLAEKYPLSLIETNNNYKNALRFSVGDTKNKLEDLSKYLQLAEIKKLSLIKDEDYINVKRELNKLKGFTPAEKFLADLENQRNKQLAKAAHKSLELGTINIDYYLKRITDEKLKRELISKRQGILSKKKKRKIVIIVLICFSILFYTIFGVSSCVARKGVKLSDGESYYSVTGLDNENSTSVTIPSKYFGLPVIGIDGYAFSGCSALTSVTIPDSVLRIGYGAFKDCRGLTKIIIPDSVTDIDSHAFEGCNNLTIYCETETQPKKWSKYWNSSNCPVVWGYTGN